MNRQEVINSLDLTKAQQAMLPTIEAHVQANGMYDLDAITKATSKEGEHSFFSAFFGGSDDVGEPSAEAELARKINAAIAQARQKGDAVAVSAAAARIKSGNHTNADLSAVCDAGLARRVYGDPQSNAPTGIEWTQRGNEHAAWETEEGLAAIGL